ncbi:MAG: DUF2946 domain-containing protein [Betaproteobacteria bacterium]|nr:DUF2946 domain-containing protein [Betaproteobacteria bacterium]
MRPINNNLKKLFLWLAVFATLAPSFAPLISRIGFGQTTLLPSWVEVCTARGMQLLPAALFENTQSPPQSEQHDGNHFEHCPFCLTSACSFGLPPGEAAILPFIAAYGRYFPPTAVSEPHTQPAWQPNQARAPPLFL